VFVYSSVPRNIAQLYLSVPKPTKIPATDEHRPIYLSVNQRINMAVYLAVIGGNRRRYQFYTGALNLPHAQECGLCPHFIFKLGRCHHWLVRHRHCPAAFAPQHVAWSAAPIARVGAIPRHTAQLPPPSRHCYQPSPPPLGLNRSPGRWRRCPDPWCRPPTPGMCLTKVFFNFVSSLNKILIKFDYDIVNLDEIWVC
jgi:hypothetical protein